MIDEQVDCDMRGPLGNQTPSNIRNFIFPEGESVHSPGNRWLSLFSADTVSDVIKRYQVSQHLCILKSVSVAGARGWVILPCLMVIFSLKFEVIISSREQGEASVSPGSSALLLDPSSEPLL